MAPSLTIDEGDEYGARMRQLWRELPGNARDTLTCLCKYGPTYDGDVPSQAGRDYLLARKMAAKIVLRDCTDGFQAATYLGAAVWRAGVELRASI
jgi:hypothetical protein